ncbi:MAG: flavin reductase family protein [Chloroflexi bacterium]|nr:flavin reductase family protein [Chloroflexota bacterium]
MAGDGVEEERVGEPSGLNIRISYERNHTMKEKLGGINALYPTPTTLVGAMVNGKPNFSTIAHIGIMNSNYISLGMGKNHHTNIGIKANKTFSVCLPSENLVIKTDYCGIVSGKNTDKAVLFDIFYGELKTAPMIQQCSVCMECRLNQIVDFPTHDIFIGEIFQTYAEASVLTTGNVDISKLKPLLFDMNSKKYWSLGGEIAKCWNIGKQLKTRKT